MHPLLPLARQAAQKSAEIVLSYYGNALVTTKEDTSVVTDADHHVHDFICETLSESLIPLLSEEGDLAPLPYPQQLWIVDPIDGTLGFIKGTGEFAVMIGLLEQGKPTLGVVHLPATNTVYYASKGDGAWMERDGVVSRLQVSDRTSPTIRALGSGAHAAPYMKEVADLLNVIEDTRIGGIGVKAGVVAEAKAEYFLTLGSLGEWDICAPQIIVEEAGGRVSDRYGDDLIYENPNARFQKGIIFSNHACHPEIIDALGRAST